MNDNHRSILVSLLLIAWLFHSNSLLAAEHCSVNSTSMIFPPYDMFEPAPIHSQAEITILCEQNLPFVVKISSGLNSSGDFSKRNMLSATGDNALLYNLYLDSSYARIWGDGTGFSEFHSGTGQGRPEMIRIFGRIPPSQNVRSGAYLDSVVISIEW